MHTRTHAYTHTHVNTSAYKHMDRDAFLFVDSKDADEVVSECLKMSACQCMHIYLNVCMLYICMFCVYLFVSKSVFGVFVCLLCVFVRVV